MDHQSAGSPQQGPSGDGNDDLECEDEEIEYAIDDQPQMVVQGLFIGSLWAEMNEPALTKAGITDILQVAQGLFPRHPLLFTYMILQVEDSPSTDLVRYFPKCFDFIDSAIRKGGSVLVHCAAGVSRSATVVLGYLMSRHNLSLAAALDHLKAVRPWVAPNQGFLQQLAAFEAAKCDLSNWQPWHLVWQQQQLEQQRQQLERQRQMQPQEQEQHVAAMDLLSLPPQPQQQHWLQVPQPRGNPSKSTQQQQQQQRSDGCYSSTHSAPPAVGRCCGSDGGGSSSSGGVTAPSGVSGLSHASLTAATTAAPGAGSGISSSTQNGFRSVASTTQQHAVVPE